MIVGQYFPRRTDWKAKAAVGGQCAFAPQTQRPCGALTTRSPIFPRGQCPRGPRTKAVSWAVWLQIGDCHPLCVPGGWARAGGKKKGRWPGVGLRSWDAEEVGALGAGEGVGPHGLPEARSPSQSCGTGRKEGLASLSLSRRKGQECHGLVP